MAEGKTKSAEEEVRLALSTQIYKRFNNDITKVFKEDVPNTPAKDKDGMDYEFDNSPQRNKHFGLESASF